MLKEKIKKLLPSKSFIILLIIALILIAAIIFFFFMLAKKESFISKNKPNLEDTTIANLMQIDTDKDGILDWEEALWGTDKNTPSTFEGMTDLAYVESKKKELGAQENASGTRLTETEKFAREFFSAYTALETGGVDDITITSFSNALGQKVVNPNLIDQYKAQDVKILKADSLEDQKKYYETIKGFFEDAKGLGVGDELDIVSEGILAHNATGEGNDFEELLIIANAYKEFADKVMVTTVPPSLQDLHLAMANGASNTGISVENMTKIISDPIVGLSGLSQYQKYSEDLIEAVNNLETTLF